VRTRQPALQSCTIGYDTCSEHGAVAFKATFTPR
jgi:hypothetical protein